MANKKDLKILVTGKNRRIAKDISEHLEMDRGYISVKCRAEKSALFDVTYSEMPNVVIICMGDEKWDEVRIYDIFNEAVKAGRITVIVVATDDDRSKFQRYTGLSRMFFISRPVSLFAIYEKLISIEAELEAIKQSNLSALTEYVNPYADKDSGRRRILVVDDDTEQLIAIKDMLSEFYDVTPVKNGASCFKYLDKHSVDLILLDYLMPEMDGPEVLKALRERLGGKDIPVIFLTGMSEKNVVIETITTLKPQGYIIKPSKKSELVAKIIDVIG